MAIDKQKRKGKAGKSQKKKTVDPFKRKEWYTIKAPALFQNRDICWSPVNKSTGTKSCVDSLKGRVFEISLADLQSNEDDNFRKMKFQVEEVQGKNCLTNFHSMDFTRDRLSYLIRKHQTLIEAHTEVKSRDGYSIRLFCIGFTKKRENQVKKTCYAQSSQAKAIRKKMCEVMIQETMKCDFKEIIKKFQTNNIGDMILKACKFIFPLQNVHIRKAVVVKRPKFDITRLMELHNEVKTGKSVPQKREKTKEEIEATNKLTAELSKQVHNVKTK